jgi:hypothetical membrane protein
VAGTSDHRASPVAVLAAGSLAGAVLFTASWLFAGVAESTYSFVHNDTSDLGALTASHPLPYNLGVSISGLLTFGLAVALVMVLPRRWPVMLGAILVAVFALGQFIDGLAREDCAVSVNTACRAAEKAGRVSNHHKVHNLESLFTFAALALAPLVFGLVWRSMPGWRRLALWSIGATVVQLACFPIFLAMYSNGSDGQGLVEIGELLVGTAWIATTSIVILRANVAVGSRPLAVGSR